MIREHDGIRYARMRGLRYHYVLLDGYRVSTPIRPASDVRTRFIDLKRNGRLFIRKDYAWDGPSGISIDTASFMRGSLVHDALYQLMRERHLDHRIYRGIADALLRDLCVADGMWRIRAWWIHAAVRAFGARNARPRPGS